MEKTINSIRFVPLAEMTDEDWDILDWDFLRNKARNRIAAMIVAGTLIGFYHVNVLMKARAKPNYYWPAEDELPLDGDTAEFFRHEADDDFESDDVENVDQMLLELRMLTAPYVVRLIAWVLAGAGNALAEDIRRIRTMQEEAEDGHALSTWDALLLAIYIYRWYGLPEFEEQMERLDREMQREENNG